MNDWVYLSVDWHMAKNVVQGCIGFRELLRSGVGAAKAHAICMLLNQPQKLHCKVTHYTCTGSHGGRGIGVQYVRTELEDNEWCMSPLKS